MCADVCVRLYVCGCVCAAIEAGTCGADDAADVQYNVLGGHAHAELSAVVSKQVSQSVSQSVSK